jgi:hypothetical protein
MTANQPATKPQSMTRQQLADQYNICTITFNRWLIRAKIEIPKNIKILTPAQVEIIFSKIGEP